MMQKPIYPAIPRDERKTVKITLAEQERIRSYRLNGATHKEIAKLFDVSTSCIWNICNLERSLELSSKSMRKYWDGLSDEKKKLKLDRQTERQRKRYAIDLEYRKYKIHMRKINRKLSKRFF